uniref:URGCP-MRPS24 readthrough n=1 Tax=Oryctolagus cuniculus TaxID=9986 RepID=A0A5F9DIF4_RABIT
PVSPGPHSDLGEVASELKAPERRAAVATADLEWRQMEGEDCGFHYGDGPNEAQDNDFPAGKASSFPLFRFAVASCAAGGHSTWAGGPSPGCIQCLGHYPFMHN